MHPWLGEELWQGGIEVYGHSENVCDRKEEGTPVAEICRKAGIRLSTYFDWKKRCERLMPSEMWRWRNLEDESGRPKKIVADLPLDREMP